jgi:peptide/nickel transport system substrate-binding protein
MPSWFFDDFEPFAYDPEEANRILDAAGWLRGADGIRAKDGVRFAGTVRTFPQRAYLPVIAEILQDQFADIGYDLTIFVGDSAEITEGQKDGSLDLGLGIRTMMYQVPDPIATLDLDFARDEVPPGAVGSTNWYNRDLRDAVTAYLATSDEAARAPHRRTIARVLHEELPVIPIAWVAENYGVSNRLAAFPIDPVLQNWRLNEIELAD